MLALLLEVTGAESHPAYLTKRLDYLRAKALSDGDDASESN